ncbi:unnamed protein product [Phytophthora lilii]|uniref:Unnamed protein product n=1 Tax=Phytophthora lilii TaxID=2077276 RepID=A0A9W6TP22_9STRA|nr:unnamed protein product [Phytophthora lilii]
MNDMQVEVFDHQLLPFDVHLVSDAWWQYWHNYRGQRLEESMDNYVAESFGLEFTDKLADTTATFYVQQILRRHVDNHRVVIIWNAYIEPFTFENKRISGIYFQEQSHVIIKRIEREASMLTRLSTCEIVTPHVLDETLVDKTKMAALTDFVASSLSNITMRNEKVEDMLLDLQRRAEE